MEGIRSWAVLVPAFGIAAGSGYIEEVIFRGVIFRIAEEALGTWSALVVTVVLFGRVHLGNPNATLYGAAAIGIEAGMLLVVAYVSTRRLWLGLSGGALGVEGSVFAVAPPLLASLALLVRARRAGSFIPTALAALAQR